VFDKDAPTSKQVFAELAKEGVRKQLHRYATWRTGDEDEANDLVANALVLVCDPEKDKTWDPSKRTFFRHMRRVLDDIAIEQKRTGAGKYEINESTLIRKTGDPDAFPDPADDRPLPDEVLHGHFKLAWLRALGQTLLGILRGRDEPAIAVFHAACIFDTPAEQASHLGVPVEEVYEAHRRLRYHGLIVRADWERAEAARMAELRKSTSKKENPS
jgi:DNA-directed RNA polymerase specialized sigma24 family protein